MYKNLFFVLLLSVTTFSSRAGELEERAEYDKRFSTLFLQEKFKLLDKQADEYRVTQSRSSSGLWMLTHFYAGIGSVANTDQDEKYWRSIESTALKWVASNPDSAAARNVYADFLVRHGWKYRGGGWAHEVRMEDWKPFYEKLAKAREYLSQNKRIASTDPRWYELMLQIARAEGWERNKVDELIYEAVSKYPYFYQIYFAALDYLVPKWHGNREEVEKFANFTVKHTKSKEDMGMYARVYWYASQTQYGNDLFVNSSVVWNKMKIGIDDVLARYPDQWNINNFARFACLAGDMNKTMELIGRIEGAPIPRAWRGDVNHFSVCKTWATRSIQSKTREKPVTMVSATEK